MSDVINVIMLVYNIRRSDSSNLHEAIGHGNETYSQRPTHSILALELLHIIIS